MKKVAIVTAAVLAGSSQMRIIVHHLVRQGFVLHLDQADGFFCFLQKTHGRQTLALLHFAGPGGGSMQKQRARRSAGRR